VSGRTILLVLAKELRETLRDRRTLVMMVVIPVFLYPVLLVVMEQAMIFGQRSLRERPSRVAVAGGPDPELVAFLSRDSSLRVAPAGRDPAASLRGGEVEAVVVLPPAPAEEGRTATVRLLFDRSADRSRHAQEVVERRLSVWGDTLLARRLAGRGLPATFAQPLVVADSSVASAEEVGGYALGQFLPMILVLMTILGAFYPAIDLAAGEKERGTLETLLTAPVPAREIVAGKFAAVALVGLAAAALNLGSMLLTFQSGLFKLSRALDISFTLPLSSVLLVLAGLVPLAVLFAAVFLGLAVRAQSFKEAQNALTPVYLASFVPIILASMPGIEFTPLMALLPVGGVAFLFRGLLAGNAPLVPSLLALGATVLYAVLALLFAARSFGREEVLFGAGAGEERPRRSLRERLRRPAPGARRVPSPGEAFALVGVVGLLFFYLAPRLMAALGERGVLASTVLLIGLPTVLFAVAGPFDARRTLGLRPVAPRTLLAAVLVGLGGMPLGWAVALLQVKLLRLEVPREMMGALEKLVTADDAARFAWLLVLVALAPAVCEELAFRGVLLRGLARRMGAWRTILLSAVVFGAFHLSYETAIRFVPTAWLGLLLGYVAWHTRSTLPTMLMHFLNNGLVVVLVSVPALRSFVFPGGGDMPSVPLLVAAPFVLGLGIWLLPRRTTRPDDEVEASAEPAPDAALAS
jgi:sodium transport system permease protein